MFRKTASVILAALMLSGVVLTATSCDIGDLLSIDKGAIDGIVGDVVGDVTGKPTLTDEQKKVIPYVGANGNWWIDEIDTGICAVGQDGITPHIGSNSNWWIGETDTGVCAVGKDGQTPTIGYNGNWWLGNNDTGISAKGPKGDKGDKGADGLTPYIGENGNWWIGNTDTGVKAGCDCNKDSGGNTPTPDPTPTPTPTPDPVDPPELDFSGRVFTLLGRESTGYEYYTDVEDISSSTIARVIYERNATVEARLNVKIQIELTPGDYSSMNEFLSKVDLVIQSGLDTYDVVSGNSTFLPIMVANGYTADMNVLDYIDFEKPWWSQSMYEEGSIDGKTYVMTGDIAYSMFENMQVIFYNQDMADCYRIAPEGFGVMDATWTLEKMMSMARNIGGDLTGDETIDTFGLVVNSQGVRGLLTGMDTGFTSRDNKGRHQMELSDKTVEAVETLIGFISENNAISWNNTAPYDAFKNGNALFCAGALRMATDFNSVFYVGILPMPCMDLDQDEYYTYGSGITSAIMIPVSCWNRDFSAVVVECLASESYRNVRPAYMESVLIKTTPNVIGYETLDIIFSSYTVPFASLYELVLGGRSPYSLVDDCYNKNAGIVSGFVANEDPWSAALEKLYTMTRNG